MPSKYARDMLCFTIFLTLTPLAETGSSDVITESSAVRVLQKGGSRDPRPEDNDEPLPAFFGTGHTPLGNPQMTLFQVGSGAGTRPPFSSKSAAVGPAEAGTSAAGYTRDTRSNTDVRPTGSMSQTASVDVHAAAAMPRCRLAAEIGCDEPVYLNDSWRRTAASHAGQRFLSARKPRSVTGTGQARRRFATLWSYPVSYTHLTLPTIYSV